MSLKLKKITLFFALFWINMVAYNAYSAENNGVQQDTSQLGALPYDPTAKEAITKKEICEGDSILWDNRYISTSGTYSYLDTAASDTIRILELTVHPLPISMTEYEVHICLGDVGQVELENNESLNYKWTPSTYLSEDNIANPKINTKVDTQYTLSVSDERCTAKVSVIVDVDSGPVIGKVDYDVHTEMVSLNIENGVEPYSYTWDNDLWQTGNAYHSQFSRLPTYVKVRDAYGCTASSHIYLDIPIEISTFFTPNGDGENDRFEIGQLSHFTHYTVRIFNSTGKLLKEYKDRYDGWDGTENNISLPSDDYWYQINIEDIDKVYLGHVTLMR